MKIKDIPHRDIPDTLEGRMVTSRRLKAIEQLLRVIEWNTRPRLLRIGVPRPPVPPIEE